MTQPSNVFGPDDNEPPRTGFAAMRQRDLLLLLGGKIADLWHFPLYWCYLHIISRKSRDMS